MPVTPAQLDTRRRALGLSVGEAAAWWGVSERAYSRWMRGDDAPRDPDGLLERLALLEEIMEGLVDAIVEQAADLTDAGPVRLDRYRSQADLDAALRLVIDRPGVSLPLGAHAVMTAWADDQLAAAGIETVIEWA